ncbi:NAD(P)/FAD-dependent oxidoreductase [Thermithiobacillus plumbiphilus]|uniref:FAD-dependent oxidoreductase n=1 Tax=Thermithiobacillus plumbiphilus TaxID=1729899 RepID=A0ABU9D7X2_9PROT
MAHIVIIGAGTGGLPLAYEMRAEFGRQHRVTVINAHSTFSFVPSNPWVGVGWRKREDISFEIAPRLARKDIHFIHDTVTEIAATENRLSLQSGKTVNYDYLVIATGPKLAFEEVPGLGPDGGHTQSICVTHHAEQAYAAYEEFCRNPGPVIVGAAPFASCFGPAYEHAFIMDKDMRSRRIRDRVPMTYVTSEPYIGHLGLGGVGDSKGLMESELRNRHINWITNARITKVEAGKMFVDELNPQGEIQKQHELPFAYSMILPAFKGVDPVAAVEGLCNPRGFVIVDKHQRSPKYPNIFSIGVCIAIPPVEATPVPTGAPKTGFMIESMGTAVVRNLKAELEGRPEKAEATWNAVCFADMGDTGAAFVALPQIPPRNVNWFRKGKWVHLAKIAFEKYFMRKMKSGVAEPFYERLAMGLIGVNRIKNKPLVDPEEASKV